MTTATTGGAQPAHSPSQIAALIDRYAAQADVVGRAVAGLSRDKLARPCQPGAWSLAQLAWHLVDSDLVASDRMKRVIAMDRPLLMSYDETAYARSLPYGSVDPALAAELFRFNRVTTAGVLRALPPEAFARVGVHSERGVEPLSEIVRMYTAHVEHHMVFAEGKRAALA